MSGSRMAAPLLALKQGYSQSAVGVLIALFALTQVFFALPAGRYADRHTLRQPVTFSVVLTIIGTGLAAIWPVFPVLCLTALLCGGATGSALIALQRHVGRLASNRVELQKVFSWMAIGLSAGSFIGPFCTGFIIDHGGYQAAFVAMTLLPLASWFLVRGTPELPLPPALPDASPTRAWDLLNNPQMRRLLIINWLLASCWDVHNFALPVLGHERGLSASVVGSILGAFSLATSVIRILLPLIAKRVAEYRVILVAMLSTGLWFAIYPFLPTPLLMGLCSVLLGLSLGSVQPMILSTLHQITPEHRQGEALGLRMMTVNASSFVMPMLFGSIGAIVGLSGLFWGIGSGVALGSRLAARLKPDKPANQPEI